MNISELAAHIVNVIEISPTTKEQMRGMILQALKTLESEKDDLIKNNQDNLEQERKGWTKTIQSKDERIKELEALTSEDTPTWKSSAFQKIKGLEAENKALREQLFTANNARENIARFRSAGAKRIKTLEEEISSFRKELEEARADIVYGKSDIKKKPRRERLYRRVEFLERRINERGDDTACYDEAELSALQWILDAELSLRHSICEKDKDIEKAQTFKGMNWTKLSTSAICSQNKFVKKFVEDLETENKALREKLKVQEQIKDGMWEAQTRQCEEISALRLTTERQLLFIAGQKVEMEALRERIDTQEKERIRIQESFVRPMSNQIQLKEEEISALRERLDERGFCSHCETMRQRGIKAEEENKALRNEVERLGSLRVVREMQEEISALRKELEESKRVNVVDCHSLICIHEAEVKSLRHSLEVAREALEAQVEIWMCCEDIINDWDKANCKVSFFSLHQPIDKAKSCLASLSTLSQDKKEERK
jgi:hypothetical protein